MKKCPNCGSVLSDFEPYCDFCGFDPDYDMGSWDYGEPASSRRPYYHGEHIKSSTNSQDEASGIIVGIIFLGVFIFAAWAYLDMYHWDIGFLILSNLESIFLIIIVIIVLSAACNYFKNI